jgi:predicted MFS family arabinose efflux permease
MCTSQFVNVLDFTMIMPLGPDLSIGLGFEQSLAGLSSAAYTLSAALSGIICSFFLDYLDRKKTLLFSLIGLSIGTIASSFATNLDMLLLTRAITGVFGGPATSLSLAIVADVVAPARRGKAYAYVMGAFPVASIIGIPLGLEMATTFSWKAPFIAVGCLGALTSLLIYKYLPHISVDKPKSEMQEMVIRFKELLFNKHYLISFMYIGFGLVATFLIVPNIATYMQFNLDYPRENLGLVYLVGGITSVFAMQLSGWLVDKTSCSLVATIATIIVAFVVYNGFYHYNPTFPVIFIMALFMVGASMRAVSMNTLCSLIPSETDRAGYFSLMSTIKHLASSVGAYISTEILTTNVDNSLLGMENLSILAIALSIAVPIIMHITERKYHSKSSNTNSHL